MTINLLYILLSDLHVSAFTDILPIEKS